LFFENPPFKYYKAFSEDTFGVFLDFILYNYISSFNGFRANDALPTFLKKSTFY
jgi:hypothetical protein